MVHGPVFIDAEVNPVKNLKVVHIYDYIHKAVYIIICALVRVFCLLRWQFTMPSLNLSLYHRDKKGESLSFREILLQNQGQGRFSAYLIGNFLRPPVYPVDLILF